MRPSPRTNPSFVVRALGDDAEQPVLFYVYHDVLEELAFSANYGEAQAAAAILLGGFGVEEDRGFVEITGFDGITWADSVEALYPDIRSAIELRLQSGEMSPVAGLFVAERGGHAHVSDEIGRLHFSLFNVPFQAALVIDPADNAVSVSARGPGGAMFNAAFRTVSMEGNSTLKQAVASGKDGNAPRGEEE